MKLSSSIVLVAASTLPAASFAQSACPDFAGKFRQIEGGENVAVNTQTLQGGKTSFSWAGQVPIILDGVTPNIAGFTGHCEGGTKMVLDLTFPGGPRSINELVRTDVGYNVIFLGQVLGSFKRE
jgi:hypothetical protein